MILCDPFGVYTNGDNYFAAATARFYNIPGVYTPDYFIRPRWGLNENNSLQNRTDFHILTKVRLR
jgi:hypothetical protein